MSKRVIQERDWKEGPRSVCDRIPWAAEGPERPYSVYTGLSWPYPNLSPFSLPLTLRQPQSPLKHARHRPTPGPLYLLLLFLESSLQVPTWLSASPPSLFTEHLLRSLSPISLVVVRASTPLPTHNHLYTHSCSLFLYTFGTS